METCNSCVPYVSIPGASTATIFPAGNGQHVCDVPTPHPLQIVIQHQVFDNLTERYHVIIGTSGTTGATNTIEFNVTISPINGSVMGTITEIPQGVAVSFSVNQFGFIQLSNCCSGVTGTLPNVSVPAATVIDVILGENPSSDQDNPLALTSFVQGDKYTIRLRDCCFSSTEATNASALFERSKYVLISSTNLSTSVTDPTAPCIGCDCLVPDTEEDMEVPQVQMTVQTTVDGSDVGQAIFVVCDQFNYKTDHPIPDNTCDIRFIPFCDVKQTKFSRCCPFIVSVLRGRGKILYDKALSIYNKLGEARIGVSFAVFYENIISYGMAKYILSRLLYGDFNINYLLGKYNDKFLHDLQNSRFCAFSEFFESDTSPVNGYNRYFKF